MSSDAGSEYEVVFVEDDGNEVPVSVQADETVLSAARRADVDLRWSCTEGECTSCTGRLVNGEVGWVAEPKAVGDEKQAEGYISLCLTRPESESRIAVGDTVLAEAFPSLWRALDTSGD